MSGSNLSRALHRTICEFVVDLKSIFEDPKDRGDLLLVEIFFGALDPDAAAQHIIRHVLPHSKHIEMRNKEFFIDEKETIFSGLPKAKVNRFSSILSKSTEEGGPSTENMEMIWKYFDTMIALAKRCRKNE